MALRRSLCLVLAVLGTAAAGAHNLGESYLYLQVYPERVSGRFEIALSDLDPALGLSGSDLEITEENFDARIGLLQDYFLERVTISDVSGPLPITFTSHEFLRARGGFGLLSFDLGGFDEVPEVLTFDYSVLFDEVPGHRGFLLIEHNWATGTFANENQISLIFGPSSRRQDFDLTSSGRLRGFLAVLVFGMEHFLLGFDHVMFLIALLLPTVLRRDDEGAWHPVDRFTPALINVVKILTAFMVAHSVTLCLSAFGLLRLPDRLVEVAIAVSIAVAAADILVPLFRGRIWMVVFFFGLFHGIGFAGALAGMGVLGENPGLSLIAYNLGVEIGQLAIVAVVFPPLFLLRRTTVYRKLVLPLAAISMIVISCIWVVERAFSLDFQMTKRVKSLVRSVSS